MACTVTLASNSDNQMVAFNSQKNIALKKKKERKDRSSHGPKRDDSDGTALPRNQHLLGHVTFPCHRQDAGQAGHDLHSALGLDA